jgi:hypothetical protein
METARKRDVVRGDGSVYPRERPHELDRIEGIAARDLVYSEHRRARHPHFEPFAHDGVQRIHVEWTYFQPLDDQQGPV